MKEGSRDFRILQWLASMPFLDRLELASVSGISEGGAYEGLAGLEGEGLADPVRHASPLTASTRRYYLTPDGVRLLGEQGEGMEATLRTFPVSAHWQRLLLERLDAVAVIYRLASAVAGVGGMDRFRWYRGMPLDAGIALPDGRTLGVLRQGPTSDGAGYSHRVWRVLDRTHPLPATLLALMPDGVRLRHARRLLARFPGPVYLAIEEEVARAGRNDPVWRLTSGNTELSLRSLLAHVPRKGALPSEPSMSRASLSHELAGMEEAGGNASDHVLPLLLKPAEKRMLDLLSLWPLIAPNDLGGLIGRSESGMRKLTTRLNRFRLLAWVTLEGRRRLALSDRGLFVLARRDRTSVSTAVKRWSVGRESPTGWRDVPGARSRHLARSIQHTESVHRFMAALAHQARSTRSHRPVQMDPPHLAARYFRHGNKLRSIHPDGFGVVQVGKTKRPFFLEWERRAVHPSTMASRLAPYLRYFSTRQPLDDHGTQPLVLVVFDDPLAEANFLGWARREMEGAGIMLPLWVSSKAALDEVGPLGPAWRNPEVLVPSEAFG